MEIRANYVLIGMFTLFGLLAGLGFFVWLAKLQIDRQYEYYDVLFSSVSGLSTAAEVRFNGINVGQVTNIQLYDEDPSKVRVRIEVGAATPVKPDTRAQLQSQGVTGVSFVALSGGSAALPNLRDATDENVPIIRGIRSTIDQITEDAPDILAETLELIKDLKTFLGPENQGYVSAILSNLDQASGKLETALADFSSISETVKTATVEIGNFATNLTPIANSVQTALERADGTMVAAESALAQVETTLVTADGAIGSVQSTFDSADTVLKDQVPTLVADVSRAVNSLEAAIAEIGVSARTTLASVEGTSDAAEARLAQLETTIDGVNATLADARDTLVSVGAASTSFDTLLQGDGAGLVADARTTLGTADRSLAAINRVVVEDVPGIATDLRAAAATASRVIDEVGGTQIPRIADDLQAVVTALRTEIDGIGGKVDAALGSITNTSDLAGARLIQFETTLANIDSTLTEADSALAAFEEASEDFDTLMDGEGAALISDARATMAEIDKAVTAINQTAINEIPLIVAEVRTAVETTNRVIDQVGADVTGFTQGLSPLTASAETALDAATGTLRTADATLTRLDASLDVADRTLIAAEGTFTETSRIMDQEVGPTAADIRAAAADIRTGVAQVTDDLPAITADIRKAIERASAVVETIDRTVANSAGSIESFAQTGLPEFTRFAQEARTLVATLDRLARRIENDPARFLIGGQPTEFRR